MTPADQPIGLSLTALRGIPEAAPGGSLLGLVMAGLRHEGLTLADGDVVVACQKIVSKVEDRFVPLARVEPGPEALDLAARSNKDPRLVELVLRESTAVVRCVRNVLIVRHRLGHVMANAGIDQSNIEGGGERVLLLPRDPDASAAALRDDIRARLGVEVAVLINDSFGRPWRIGTTGACIGAAGLRTVLDQRGDPDRFGRTLQVTQVAAGDELAAAASLMMGQADEGRPVVLARGVPARFLGEGRTADLFRAQAEDLFA